MIKALLDTNIVIAREAGGTKHQDIGILFKWLDRANYKKCIHPVTVYEINKNPNTATVFTFNIKLSSYEIIQFPAPMAREVSDVSEKNDLNENDFNDSILLNELYCGTVDLLLTEDKRIHHKARELNIHDKVFKINTFLEKTISENPSLVDYKVLAVRKEHFANLNLDDPFFETLKEDYPLFDNWFFRKREEVAYISYNTHNKRLLSFLFLKREFETEVYSDIQPIFKPKKRLKIGTFKVVGNGFRLGERFMKIIFDNALTFKVDEIYVTIFERREEQMRLVELMVNWGFEYWGKKENGESVYVRVFNKKVDFESPRQSFPFLSIQGKIFLVPIYPDYHTELFPDSILRTESPVDFIDNAPHRNAISKVYVSRSKNRNVSKGDILVFYRTGGIYKGVITTICIVEEVIQDLYTEEQFVKACRKRSVYSEESLRNQWRYNSKNRPFIVSLLYTYSFPKRINLKTLIENRIIVGMNDIPRGFKEISQESFRIILRLTRTDASFIIN